MQMKLCAYWAHDCTEVVDPFQMEGLTAHGLVNMIAQPAEVVFQKLYCKLTITIVAS